MILTDMTGTGILPLGAMNIGPLKIGTGPEISGLIIALLGLLIGSFLNVCIWRIPRGQSIVLPASRCPSCNRRLRAWELVPLLSYFCLGGRCLTCRAAIPRRYPLVEAMTGLLFLAAYGLVRNSQALPAALCLISVLVTVSFIDWDCFCIPDGLLWIALVGGLASAVFLGAPNLRTGIIGLLAGGGLLLLIYLLGRGGMGFGDVKLGAVLGFYLGVAGAVLAVFLASLLAAVVGCGLIVSGRKSRKDAIAFAPFLGAAGIIVLFWGEQLISQYLHLFFPGWIR